MVKALQSKSQWVKVGWRSPGSSWCSPPWPAPVWAADPPAPSSSPPPAQRGDTCTVWPRPPQSDDWWHSTTMCRIKVFRFYHSTVNLRSWLLFKFIYPFLLAHTHTHLFHQPWMSLHQSSEEGSQSERVERVLCWCVPIKEKWKREYSVSYRFASFWDY